MNSSKKIKKFILDNLSQHQKDIIQEAIVKFGISRQAVHRHMNSLIVEKKVAAFGNTKGRYYELMPMVNYNKTINIVSSKGPNHLLKKIILPHLKSLSKNIYEIFEFSISALLNNVYAHADASKLYFKIFVNRDVSHFILSDNGIGIESHALDRLFERFYRVDKNRSREIGGTGLGLAIVKHILEGHNQQINVRSTPGLGTTFSFILEKGE